MFKVNAEGGGCAGDTKVFKPSGCPDNSDVMYSVYIAGVFQFSQSPVDGVFEFELPAEPYSILVTCCELIT